MSSILFDTHVFMWWLADATELTKSYRERIRRAPELFVSAASYWEIATKHRIGKLPDGPAYLLPKEDLSKIGIAQLPIEAEEARAAGALEWDHRDPYDRMLVCQAQLRGLALVTTDETILSLQGAERRRRRR